MRYNGAMHSLPGVMIAWVTASVLFGQDPAKEASPDPRQVAKDALAKWEGSDLADEKLLGAAVAAILVAGAPALEDLGARVQAIAALQPPDRRRTQAMDAALTHVAIGYLERETKAEMVYEGQYAPLRPLQPFVGKLYLGLLLDTPDWYDQGNRHVLVAPLRDIFPQSPGAEAMKALREIATDEDFEPEPLRQNLAFALAQWGDSSLVDARVARIEKDLADVDVGSERRTALRYELADIWYTLRAYERSARIHVELLRQAEQAEVPLMPNHYYNAACSLARAGQGDAALAELERAVARQLSGRVDPSLHLERKLFEQDHDLDSVRADARFRALVEKAFGAGKADRARRG